MTYIPSFECVEDGPSSVFRPEELLTPTAFPHPVTQLKVLETDVSWVILTGRFAYKVTKAVREDGIDAATAVQRHHLCLEALRLNRRLAPDVYLDVVAITREDRRLRIGGPGPTVEYAIKMQQFDASQYLSVLLDSGTVSDGEIVELARRLARFHSNAAKAARSPHYEYTEQLRKSVLGNLALLISHIDTETILPTIGSVIDWTHDYLHDSLATLRTREASGFIRECHGDLHARNIVLWQDQLTPLHCVEFDPTLRWIDVMSDVAFLVMDLAAHDRRDLAYTFLDAYLETSGDYEGVRAFAFYAVYRALVRAMVDSLSVEHAERGDALRLRMRKRVKTASEFMERPGPALIVMHGPSGSGKSWLSGQLIQKLEAVCIRSDVERQRIANAHTVDSCAADPKRDLYTPEINHRTYARLVECAENCLEGGVNTIVDAAFLKSADRSKFYDLARRRGIPYVILSCEPDHAALTQPIERRIRAGSETSNTGISALKQQLQLMDPLSKEEQSHLIAADTTRPAAEVRAQIAIQRRIRKSHALQPWRSAR